MKWNNKKQSTLEDKRTTFFLFGLILVLLGIYGLFNLKQYEKEKLDCALKEVSMMDENQMPITRRTPPEPPQEKVKEVKKETRNVLSSIFIEIPNAAPDPNDDFNEPLDEIPTFSEEVIIEVIMEALDKKPVFPGCENILTEKERYACFVENIRGYVARKLKPCSGPWGVIQENLIVSFVITQRGEIADIEVLRGEDQCTIDRTVNVIKSLPSMQPGQYRGKAVKTRFTLPVNIRQN